MTLVIRCECGRALTDDDEDEFVEMVIAHAKASHAITLTREQVLALATSE